MVGIEVKGEGNVGGNWLRGLVGKRGELDGERFCMLGYKVEGNVRNFGVYGI